MVILGVFTAALRRKTGTQRPTAGQEKEFKRAITCVRYLTDFALLSRYRSHTDSTIKYMRQYLQRFHATKDVFLRYRASKSAKARADVVSKELTEANKSRNEKANANGRTATQKARAAAEDKEERAYLVNQVLVEDSHFNFPKLHLIMHWADHISRYGSLPQFSTEICETSHKAFKEAYRRSNHLDSIPQIIKGYSRNHNLAVRELEIATWADEDPAIAKQVEDAQRPKGGDKQLIVTPGTKIFMRLRSKRSGKEIYNIPHIAAEFKIPDLANQVREFLEVNVYETADDPQSAAETMISNATVEAYTSLEIPVPSQDVDDNNTYQLQRVRTTGCKEWRGGGPRRDAVWVRITEMKFRAASDKRRIRGYNGRVIGFLNAIFILKGKSQEIYKLAHVTRLSWTGNGKPSGAEGMSYVGEVTGGGCQNVVWVHAIEGAVHLIPLEPNRHWIVNNRVDYHVWNEVNDE
jgi:hypothetical protein